MQYSVFKYRLGGGTIVLYVEPIGLVYCKVNQGEVLRPTSINVPLSRNLGGYLVSRVRLFFTIFMLRVRVLSTCSDQGLYGVVQCYPIRHGIKREYLYSPST